MFNQLLLQTFDFSETPTLFSTFPKKTLTAMATKNDQLSAAQLSEISTIRNILMGQQMSEYESQFNKVSDEIASARGHFAAELKTQDEKTDGRFQQLEKDMNERFDRLEKLLADHVHRLDDKLLEISKSDKNDLGKMLSDLSKKLMAE